MTARTCDPATVKRLARALGASVDSRRRRNAARALGQLGPLARGAVYDLATAAVSDADETVRCESAQALSKLGKVAMVAVPGLAAALHDPRPAVRAAAALTLNEIWKIVVDRREEIRGGR